MEFDAGWRIDVLDDGLRYGDGGRETEVVLSHLPSQLRLSGTAVYWAEGDAVLSQLRENDLCLSTHSAGRLLSKICSHYVPHIGAYGDCGLTVIVGLEKLFAALFQSEEDADALKEAMLISVRTFSALEEEKHDSH